MRVYQVLRRGCRCMRSLTIEEIFGMAKAKSRDPRSAAFSGWVSGYIATSDTNIHRHIRHAR